MDAPLSQLVEEFGAEAGVEPGRLPEPELFPKRLAWIVRNDGGGGREAVAVQWGVASPKGGAPVTNVRNLASPFWRSSLARTDRRCLVPVTRFCEWEGAKGSKVARWFSVPSEPLFAFAGIWRPSSEGDRFAFLTCAPNPLVAPIHPKAMPVLLGAEERNSWLTDSWDEAQLAVVPFPSQLMAVE
jgi:putative SOS response-associated peptidase YedK